MRRRSGRRVAWKQPAGVYDHRTMQFSRGLPALFLSAATLLAAPDPTFTKDVLPILQARCQECHRPGEIGPMPLLNYQQARPWAAAIKESVRLRKMPPW